MLRKIVKSIRSTLGVAWSRQNRAALSRLGPLALPSILFLVALSCASSGDPNASPQPSAQAEPISVTIDLGATTIPISPYIYGKNNSLSDQPSSPLSASQKAQILESGLRFSRENGGNNATKYNWRRKLTSHPDWYNNVYSHDWDFLAQSAQSGFADLQVMFAFQLLGKAASNTDHNFNDWAYNKSAWWQGVSYNLAGGGTVNGTSLGSAGDPDSYLETWTANDSVAILDHFSQDLSLGLQGNFVYWSMDNEPEIWHGTHDDVMPSQCSPEEFMQRYFAVAKAARAAFHDVKLTGPVPCSEWQWYAYAVNPGTDNPWGLVDGLPWLEYFIKSVAEEEKSSGVRLLDMVDIHAYPTTSSDAERLQLHRVFFDREYPYPEANGVHLLDGAWGATSPEYILGRARAWCEQYGLSGVGVGVTEADSPTDDPMINALWYASCLGEFMANEGEVFCPWSWKPGMWEVLHLFARYNRPSYLSLSQPSDQELSLYPSVDSTSGAMTIIMVNRSKSDVKTIKLNLTGATFSDGDYPTLSLSGLGSTETFVSHSKNALKRANLSLVDRAAQLSLPPLSICAVILDK